MVANFQCRDFTLQFRRTGQISFIYWLHFKLTDLFRLPRARLIKRISNEHVHCTTILFSFTSAYRHNLFKPSLMQSLYTLISQKPVKVICSLCDAGVNNFVWKIHNSISIDRCYVFFLIYRSLIVKSY